MSIELLIGFTLALFIGISLGLIGGGGSILTVPVLVYGLQVAPVEATAYSLFIVGVTSAVGAIGYQRQGLIAWRTGLLFALPSLVAVFLVRSLLLPAIPDPMGGMIGISFPKEVFIMVLFALIMAMASFSMIRDGEHLPAKVQATVKARPLLILLEGFGVGAVTGLVGAGGGFLIIPALVILMGLPMRMAVGTSLMIIALKSLLGFMGDVLTMPYINWSLIVPFTLLSLMGVGIGVLLSSRIPSKKLKKGFGIFVAFMAILILINELL